MRIETTRSAGALRLEHAAGFHATAAHLRQLLAPLADAAVARGEPLAVALEPVTEEALAGRLGDDVRLARLTPAGEPDGASAQTTAARWALELRALAAASGTPVTVLTEHVRRLDGADGRFWTELDAALNVALADLPVRMTCFYPQVPLHLEITEGARLTHPLLLDDGELHHKPQHLDPRAVLADRPAQAPPLLGPPDVHLPFGAWQLHEVRAAVERALAGSAHERDRVEDVVLAVNEVATNAVEHGTPHARLSLWTGGPALLCEIDDGGTLRDPLPGLQPPHPSEPRGRGVWIARQLCDSLHIWADDRGTHVRMRADP